MNVILRVWTMAFQIVGVNLLSLIQAIVDDISMSIHIPDTNM